ncbi:DNA polymerase III, subunit gamma and tau [Bifidobacterium bifidum]|nr:DNA polymerase III, subunit gamma and tau [Bifidobacterium bifidum]
MRDLLVLTLAGDRAESVLSDTAEAEDMDDLHRQAKALGLSALTAIADIINTTLGAMTGAISPRMRLELLAARLLAGSGKRVRCTRCRSRIGSSRASHRSCSLCRSRYGRCGRRLRWSVSRRFRRSLTGWFLRRFAQPIAVTAADPANAPAANAGGWNAAGTLNPAGSAGQTGAAGQAAPAQQAMPAAAAPAAPASPATNAAAPSSDSRSTDEKWNAAVAALPQAIREYVTRDKVPTVAFGPNRKGLPCLSMTFDKPLSQHAFALAVDNSGKKAAIVVMDAVRQEFGADAVIAPAAVAANGERVESVKRLSPEQLAKVKQQIAMAKAGLAASSLGAGLGMHSGSEPKAQKPAAEGNAEDADGSHRASGVTPGGTSNKPDLDDDDPWAKPAASSEAVGEPSASAGEPSVDGFAPSNPDPASAQAPEEHHKKHVARAGHER